MHTMSTKASKRFGGKRRRLPFSRERPPSSPLRRSHSPPAEGSGVKAGVKKAPKSKSTNGIGKPFYDACQLILDCVKQLATDLIHFIKDDKEAAETQMVLFPRYFIYLLMILTIWSRTNIVLNSEGLWILHPDEVFQSIEVAHSEVYGYGFRPYEFFDPPPDDNGSEHPLWSPALERYRSLQMYSMRSFIYPNVYRWVFMAKEYFGWVLPPFQLAKLFHSIVAGMLPFIVYKFSYFLYGGRRDPALLSSVLVAFSQPLLVLGTRTFVQSFLSPFLFLCLSAVLKQSAEIETESASNPDGEGETDETPSGENSKYCDDDFDFDLNDNKRQLVITDSRGQPIELDVIDVRFRTGLRRRRAIARCTGVLCMMFAGIILGISMYVRPDTFIVVVTTLLFFSFPIRRVRENLERIGIPLILGLAVALFIGGWNDFSHYGHWFISPRQWVRFQWYHAHKLFGSHGFFMYFRELSSKSHSVYILGFVILITGFLQIMRILRFSSVFLDEFSKQNSTELRTWRRLAAISFVIVSLYSFHAHKELRFVHDFIVLFLILAGGSLYVVFKTFYVFLVEVADLSLSKKRFVKLFLYGEIMLYVFAGRLHVPHSSDPKSIRPWSYAGLAESGLVNQCLMYVSNQNDVKGVVIDYSIHMTGAYSLLHRDIPLIAKTHYEFREWNLEDRLVLSSVSALTRKNIGVSVLDKISNFIAVENAPLLLKHFSNSSSYNYIITTEGRSLPKKGFHQVFNASDVRVFKKGKSRLDKEALEELSNRLPLGTNATILEYEGSWLVTLGLFPLAVERLQEALKIEPSRIRSWQLLSHALNHLGRKYDAGKAMTQCHAIYKNGECLQQTDKIVLHSEYRL